MGIRNGLRASMNLPHGHLLVEPQTVEGGTVLGENGNMIVACCFFVAYVTQAIQNHTG